jgi:hypothetical protein
VGIGGGSGVKDVEEGCVLLSVCRSIKRSVLIGTVHKLDFVMELALEVGGMSISICAV